jgi:ParB-like chromosome segregation protein Spo0J
VDIDTLRPHPRNARNGDTDAIAESLRVNGQYRPIVIAADGTILAGNHTYMAAMEIGWDRITAVRIDVAPDGPEAHRIMLADNRTADLGNYDRGLLADLLVNLNTDVGLIGTGYTEEYLTDLLEQLEQTGPIIVDDPVDDGPSHSMTCPQCGYEFSGKGQ